MGNSKRVFISSTAKDLAEYRDAVHEVIRKLDGFEAVRMEDFGARAATAEDFCSAEVAKCDLMIGIVGFLYGSSPEGSDRSFTEIEYDAAVKHGVPRIMFVAPDDFAVPAALLLAEKRADKQAAFRERVDREQIRDTFRSPEDLKSRVQIAIGNWQATTAKDGMEALGELTRVPQVREDVLRYQTAFQIASDQIDAVVDYKDMHDQLHNLQFRCFDMIVQEANRFPEESSVANLDAHEMTLEEIIEQLGEIGNRPSLGGREMGWIGDLEDARADLRGALAASDPKQLKQSIWRMNRVLAIQPSAVNNRLNNSARNLLLDELLEALDALKGKMDGMGLETDKLKQFHDGVEAIATMRAEIGALTDEHDKWQVVENEVRRIENNVSNLIEELTNSWPGLIGQTARLVELEAPFGEDVERLGADLANGEEARIKGSFRRYRRRIGSTFHRVDTDLKRRCHDLRQLGRGITAILEKIG